MFACSVCIHVYESVMAGLFMIGSFDSDSSQISCLIDKNNSEIDSERLFLKSPSHIYAGECGNV